MADAAAGTIDVVLFAAAREVTGCRSCTIDIPPHATMKDVHGALLARYPALAKIESTLRYAVDEAFVSVDTPVAPGAQIAVIPPVGGG